MRSQSGITMTSLIMYVASFLVITGIVGFITTYFYNNINILDTNSGSAAEYNKFNVYFLKQVKTNGVKILKYNDNSVNSAEESYITFLLPDSTKNTFVNIDNSLYFNYIKLVENVSKFSIKIDENNHNALTVYIEIDGKAYSTVYTLEN